jgi:hypothetical protein
MSVVGDAGGYTLLETVVAMALFTSVLLPVALMMGNFMIDNTPDLIANSLNAAVSEMSRTAADKDYNDKVVRIANTIILTKIVVRDGDLVKVHISAASEKHPKRELLVLHKTFLIRP